MSGRFTDAALAVFATATTLAKMVHSVAVEPRHLLAALMLDAHYAVALIHEQDESAVPRPIPEPHLSRQASAIVEAASELAIRRGEVEAAPADVALAILRSRDPAVHAALAERDIDVTTRALLFHVGGSAVPVEMFDDLYQPEKWSEEGHRIVHGARFECEPIHTDYIGSEHILLSLLRDSDNVAALFLERFYPIPITIAGMPRAVRSVEGVGGCMMFNRLRFTMNAKRLLTDSQLTARRMARSFVGSEHILFAVLANRGSTAARALSKRVNLDRLERDLRRAFGVQ